MKKLLISLSLIIIALALLIFGYTPTKAESKGLWVKTGTKYYVTENTNEEKNYTISGYSYINTFDGEVTVKGKQCIQFTQNGGWFIPEQYGINVAEFQSYCEIPADTYKPGELIKLTKGINTVSFTGSRLGIFEQCNVKIDFSGIAPGIAGNLNWYFAAEDGSVNTRAHLGDQVYGGNSIVSHTIKENPTNGDKLSIYFNCWAGMYEWQYEYQENPTIKVSAPKKATIKTLSISGTKLTVTAKKITKNCKGYEVQISTNKNFSNATIKTSTKNKITIKGLKENTYYVRIRAYNESGSTIKYGKWSKVKTVTIS